MLFLHYIYRGAKSERLTNKGADNYFILALSQTSKIPTFGSSLINIETVTIIKVS